MSVKWDDHGVNQLFHTVLSCSFSDKTLLFATIIIQVAYDIFLKRPSELHRQSARGYQLKHTFTLPVFSAHRSDSYGLQSYESIFTKWPNIYEKNTLVWVQKLEHRMTKDVLIWYRLLNWSGRGYHRFYTYDIVDKKETRVISVEVEATEVAAGTGIGNRKINLGQSRRRHCHKRKTTHSNWL